MLRVATKKTRERRAVGWKATQDGVQLVPRQSQAVFAVDSSSIPYYRREHLSGHRRGSAGKTYKRSILPPSYLPLGVLVRSVQIPYPQQTTETQTKTLSLHEAEFAKGMHGCPSSKNINHKNATRQSSRRVCMGALRITTAIMLGCGSSVTAAQPQYNRLSIENHVGSQSAGPNDAVATRFLETSTYLP